MTGRRWGRRGVGRDDIPGATARVEVVMVAVKWLVGVGVAASVWAIAGCDDDGGGPAGPPALAPGEVAVVEPGGATLCGRGTPYRFGAVGGDADRVVIDFQGGGACWNTVTCGFGDALFSDDAPDEATLRAYLGGPSAAGIYDLDDPRNPVAGWTFLHIPYCTGDIHWGDATVHYTDALTIHHRGLENTLAALSWLAERYPSPDEIFVTGCSAGAYGAIGHAARIAERFPSARVRVLGDSGAGIITDSFFEQSFPSWAADATLPMHLPELDGLEVRDLDIVDLYTAVAGGVPDIRVAQYNAAFDDDQRFFYEAMGGGGDWPERMRANLDAIASAADAFTSYTAPGPVHCVSPYPIFYTRAAGAAEPPRPFVEWLEDLLHGAAVPAPVACEGLGCRADPVCEACLAEGDTSGPVCRWCEGWSP